MAGRPDIILFLTDDHAPWSLGCYGSPIARTANLDTLSAGGVRFTNAFTPCPVCSPARACLMTGLTPSQVGIHDWIEESEPEIADRDWLAGQITMPMLLRQNGYHTALAGKWHLGRSHQTPPGFDHAFGLPGWQGLHNGEHSFHLDGTPLSLTGNKTALITDYAERFIESAPADQPLFLNVGFIATHSPYTAHHHDSGRTALFHDADFGASLRYAPHSWVKNEGISGRATIDETLMRECLVGYFAASHEIDAAVGRVIRRLQVTGRLDRAIIIYVSDHGCSIGQNGFFGKGNSTRPLNMYDVSLRVPLIMNGPTVPSGRAIHECVDHYDLFQSVLAFAGVSTPKDSAYPGRSALPLMHGQEGGWEQTRYGEYGDLRMIRTPTQKLVRRQPNGPDERFDLSRDPGELHPITPTPADEITRSLVSRLDAWYAAHERPETSGMRVKQLPRHNRSAEAWRDGLRELAIRARPS